MKDNMLLQDKIRLINLEIQLGIWQIRVQSRSRNTKQDGSLAEALDVYHHLLNEKKKLLEEKYNIEL